ncbi:MAG: hypothetical protein ACK452_00510, partial [Bacteroidota bacterium]|jgi:hypothetical protein
MGKCPWNFIIILEVLNPKKMKIYFRIILFVCFSLSFQLKSQKPGLINTTRSNIKNEATPLGNSQENTFDVKNKNQLNKVSNKKLYTLKQDEKLFSEESFINISSLGEQYEFITVLNNLYYIHVSGKDFGPFASPPKRISPMKYFCQTLNKTNNNYEFNYLDLTTGKSAGPYQSAEFWSYLKNSEPNGYYYQKNDLFYVKIFGQPADLGPYEQVNLLILAKGRSEFTYKKDGGFYVYNNGRSTGPYKDLQLTYSDCSYPVYTYKQSDNNFFISINYKTFGPYSTQPQFCYSKAKNDSKFFIYEANGNYKGYYILKDGSKIPGNEPYDNTSIVFSTGDKTWIRLEKPNVMKAKSEGKKINCNSSAAWNITYSDGKTFGPANIGDEYSSFAYLENEIAIAAINPPMFDCDVNTGTTKNISEKNSLYIIGKNGVEGPIDDINGTAKQAESGKSKYGFVVDKELYFDKKKTGIKDIFDFKFTDPSKNDNWYAISRTSGNDSLTLYINGKKTRTINFKKGQFENIFINSESDYSYTYRVDNSVYFKSANSNSEFGPFENLSLNNSAPLTLVSKKTIGFIANYTNVIINGVDAGEGTALICNQKTGTFSWLSTDGKTISMSTIKP